MLFRSPHFAKRWEPHGFSRVAAAFSSYDGDLSLPLGLALGKLSENLADILVYAFKFCRCEKEAAALKASEGTS